MIQHTTQAAAGHRPRGRWRRHLRSRSCACSRARVSTGRRLRRPLPGGRWLFAWRPAELEFLLTTTESSVPPRKERIPRGLVPILVTAAKRRLSVAGLQRPAEFLHSGSPRIVTSREEWRWNGWYQQGTARGYRPWSGSFCEGDLLTNDHGCGLGGRLLIKPLPADCNPVRRPRRASTLFRSPSAVPQSQPLLEGSFTQRLTPRGHPGYPGSGGLPSWGHRTAQAEDWSLASCHPQGSTQTAD